MKIHMNTNVCACAHTHTHIYLSSFSKMFATKISILVFPPLVCLLSVTRWAHHISLTYRLLAHHLHNLTWVCNCHLCLGVSLKWCPKADRDKIRMMSSRDQICIFYLAFQRSGFIKVYQWRPLFMVSWIFYKTIFF